MPDHHVTINLPPLRELAGHAGRHLIEATIAPLGLFYLVLLLSGFQGALIAAASWTAAAVGWRVVRGKPIPALLWLTTLILAGRTVLGFATGSVFLYFLQPTLQNFVFAFVLLATLRLRTPFIAKLASDFCAFPDTVTGHPRLRCFFQRVSLLWAVVFIVNGATTLWMLAGQTVEGFLVMRTAGTYTLVTVAALGSLWWFRRSLRGAGITLHLSPRLAG